MDNIYKKTTPYIALGVAGFLAVSSLVGCKSLARRREEKKLKASVVTEEVVKAPEVKKEIPEVKKTPAEEEKKEEVAALPEPKKSLEEKVAKAPIVSPAPAYVPKTSDIILDYITALEPDIDDLYQTLPSRAQAFGVGFIDGLATEIDNLDMDYKLLGNEAGDYLAKTADVAGLVMEAEDRFKKTSKTEQEIILAWAGNLNKKLKDYINSDSEGAKMFYNGLLDYVANQEKAVQEKFIMLYDAAQTLGINAF